MRLRTAILVPFVLQISTIVGLVGYLSFRNGQEAVNKLARQVRIEVASRTQGIMENYFKEPHKITSSNIHALQLKEISLENKEGMEQHLLSNLKVFPAIGESYVGLPDGSIIYVARKEDGTFVANTHSKFPIREQYELDNQGRRTKLLKVTNTFDARLRPWYKIAVEKREKSWTDVYLFVSSQTLGIAAAEPYYDQQGKLLAIFSTNLPLQRLSNFLRDLKVSQTGQAFVIDRSGSLAATSTGEEPFIEVNGENKQAKAVESQNLLTNKTSQYLQKEYGDFTQIKEQRELLFDIDGQRQYVLVQPYSDGKGLDFLVVVVVPEKDFMGEINANTQSTIWLCLLALGLSLIISILTAQRITRPILRITEASESLANGNFDQHISLSKVVEISRLATSFNKMSMQIKSSFAKLNLIIVEADQVGDQISNSTSQITIANQELEATATHQATSTNEVKSTAHKIALTSGQLVKTMENITQQATATELAASQGQKSLTAMAEAMNQLAEATNSIASRLGVMNEKANKINSVVVTIAKVADQTNLLSLNAAIEAEKAGEAGIGFAVVAREVRRLADNSASASQEIEETVKEIQFSVSNGVMEMDKFSKQVNFYVEQVSRISIQIAEVIQKVQNLTPQFKQISHSMEEQFEGAQQISSAIAQLSEASQETVASLQNTNHALDQLNNTAHKLQNVVKTS